MPKAAPKFDTIRITTVPVTDDEEMVELFSIDGKSYMIPARPRTNLALQVVDDLVKYGAGMAEMMMLQRAIGEENYNALKECNGVTPKILAQLGEAVTRLTLGALEENPGN